jgi:RimJ/RimL family protein N-acetyltransferase
VTIRLIEIGPDGWPAEALALPEVARSACQATAQVYQKTGFMRPWIGYLAQQDGRLVGTCAFKSPPQAGRAEIAYYTFPEFEGRGIATAMARQLIQLAKAADLGIVLTAQTLPEENASTAILRKLGFQRAGMAYDSDVGDVWEWQIVQGDVRAAAMTNP